MICYKDTTFCAGGAPRCACFTTCPRALTEDVQARAKAAELPISQYIAPNAMPCYRADPDPAKEAHKSRRRFASQVLTDEQWKAEIEREPRRSDVQLAAAIGCTSQTVGNNRRRLGISPAKPSGVTRHTIFSETDALRLIAAYKKADCSFAEAARRLGIRKNTAKHLRQRFKAIFEQHGF